jgi:hypothetical protein
MPPETIAAWLIEIGLRQYVDLFEREQIGLDLVTTLTEGDLIQLGLPLGPCKRLQNAVSVLASRSPVVLALPLKCTPSAASSLTRSALQRPQINGVFLVRMHMHVYLICILV